MIPCATAENLEQLLLGTLDEAEANRVRKHAHNCLHCQALLDRLSDHEELRQWAHGAHLPMAGDAAPPIPERLFKTLCDDTPPETTVTSDSAPVDKRPAPDGYERIGPYQILGELGRGGMGIVLKAYDSELSRVVALKLLNPGRSDAHARARFVREARAVAGLDHDHVVAVYAVANPPDGPPYFAMQYVAGPTLREHIHAQKQLEPREAATIGRQVADGLAAAHAAGLVHRDIKPANIILEKDRAGRAKIVDFGLVRVNEVSGGTTQQGTIPGTPEYMSPEQVRDPATVDARSDVYSLGVTLYEALTGDVPFRGVPHMVLQQVLEHEPTPPRRWNDRIPRDLETICLKAMAKEPGRRYSSAQALRDDLQRWLAGEPIQARPVGRVEKAVRWCKRKPALAGVSVALVVVFLVGIVSVFSQWRRAESNFKDADRERADAEKSLQQALETVNQFCTEVSQDVLLNEPGMQPLRRQLLQTARDSYQKFIQERGDNPRLRRELAQSYLRLGLLESEIGSPDEALDLMTKGAALFDQLAADKPTEAVHADDRAMAHNALGNQYRSLKQLSKAQSAMETALAIQEDVVRRDPAAMAYQNRLANILDNLGLVYSDLKYLKPAEAAFDRSLAIWERLAADRDAANYAESRATVHEHLAQLYRARIRIPLQQAALERALVLRTTLWQSQPGNSRYRADLARTHDQLGIFYGENRRVPDSITTFQTAIDTWQQLADDNRRVTRYQQSLAKSYRSLGQVNETAGKLADAEAAQKKAFEIRERLAAVHPNHPEYQADFADSYFKLGVLHRLNDRMPESEKAHMKALGIHQQNAAMHPDVPEFQENLARAHNDLSLVHKENKKLGPAMDELRLTLDLWGALARRYEEAGDYPDWMARTHSNIADIYFKQDQFDEAIGEYRRALDIWETMARKAPRPRVLTPIALTYVKLAHIARDIGHDRADSNLLRKALDDYDGAEKSLRQLLLENEHDSDAMFSLRNVHWGRAQTLEFLDRWQEAVPEWDKALELELKIEPVQFRDQICLLRARARARIGQHAEAVAETEELVSKKSVSPDSLVAGAKVCAAAAAAAQRDSKLSSSQQSDMAEAHAARAVDLLRKALSAGAFKIPAHAARTERDPDLKLLRERADFQDFLSQVKQSPDSKSR